MDIPEKVARYLTLQLDLDEDKQSVILYSGRIISSTLLSYSAIVAVAYLAGVFKYALVAVLTNTLIRQYAGGAHASTPYRCATIGAFIFTGLGLLTEYWPIGKAFTLGFYAVVAILSLLLIWWYAPADTPNKPISHKDKNSFRRKAMVVWFLWAVFVLLGISGLISFENKILLASTLGLLWESFTLTPGGYRFIAVLDGMWDRLPRKGGMRP